MTSSKSTSILGQIMTLQKEHFLLYCQHSGQVFTTKKYKNCSLFYSLCSYVLDKFSSRSVYLGVCPVQFAVYLRLRAVRNIGCCSQIIFTKLFEEYLEHTNTCKCNHLVKSGGRTAVLTVFHNYSIAVNKPVNIRLSVFGSDIKYQYHTY